MDLQTIKSEFEKAKEEDVKRRNKKLFLIFSAILWLGIMAYIVYNIEIIKNSPCDICEKQLGQTCEYLTTGLAIPTADIYGELPKFNITEIEGVK